jgi:hypothetical protein
MVINYNGIQQKKTDGARETKKKAGEEVGGNGVTQRGGWGVKLLSANRTLVAGPSHHIY